MIIFMQWSNPRHRPGLEAHSVSAALGDLFSPLMDPMPQLHSRAYGQQHVIWAGVPVHGWRPDHYQQDDQTTALAIHYPLNACRALASLGIAADPRHCLPALARAVQQDPDRVLEMLHPPFAMFWHDRLSGDRYLVNDALGHAQIFESERDGRPVLTNRLAALKCIDVDLTPAPDQWALKSCLGWFTGHHTGFPAVRYLEPGSLLVWSGDRFSRQRRMPLKRWVTPSVSGDDDHCKETARHALIDYVEDTWALFSRASGGLTGGYDSRAIFATLRYLDRLIPARVKGPPNNYDVIVSRMLAETAGMALEVKSQAEHPPETPEAIRRSVAAAVIWQAAAMDNTKLISFMRPGQTLSDGIVNVMGLDGAIGRGFFHFILRDRETPPARWEDRLADWFRNKVPPVFQARIMTQMEETLRRAFRRFRNYDVAPQRAFDFFYLFERTRRWSAGAQNAQGSVVLAPFLNHGFIRSAFGYTGDDLHRSPLHRHIIATHAPDWKDIPYAVDLKKADKRRKAPSADWRHSDNTAYFDHRRYWQQVGLPLLEESLRRGRLWRDIFDADAVNRDPVALANELVMLYVMEHIMAGADLLE